MTPFPNTFKQGDKTIDNYAKLLMKIKSPIILYIYKVFTTLSDLLPSCHFVIFKNVSECNVIRVILSYLLENIEEYAMTKQKRVLSFCHSFCHWGKTGRIIRPNLL